MPSRRSGYWRTTRRTFCAADAAHRAQTRGGELRIFSSRMVRLLTLTGPGGTGEDATRTPGGRRPCRRPTRTASSSSNSRQSPTRRLVTPAIPRRHWQSTRPAANPSLLLSRQSGCCSVLDKPRASGVYRPQLLELLAQAPDLKAFWSRVGSRSASRPTEHPVRRPPLALPDPENLPVLSALSQCEAVALFIERARAVQPKFEVTNSNAPAVAELCVRIDGLPLALELAAARIALPSPESMFARMSERLKLHRRRFSRPSGSTADAAGHARLGYDLLSDDGEAALPVRTARRLRGRLHALDEADEICGARIDALASLVERTLVRNDRERFTVARNDSSTPSTVSARRTMKATSASDSCPVTSLGMS